MFFLLIEISLTNLKSLICSGLLKKSFLISSIRLKLWINSLICLRFLRFLSLFPVLISSIQFVALLAILLAANIKPCKLASASNCSICVSKVLNSSSALPNVLSSLAICLNFDTLCLIKDFAAFRVSVLCTSAASEV